MKVIQMAMVVEEEEEYCHVVANTNTNRMN